VREVAPKLESEVRSLEIGSDICMATHEFFSFS